MADLNDVLSGTIPYTDITVMQIIAAIVVLIVGFIVLKIAVSIFRKGLSKTKLPDLIIEFLTRFLSALLYVMLILLVVTTLGFQMGSVFLGLSAVIGLILGFGLQGTLTNIAAGVWIASLRPIDKDEVVTVNGLTGKVRAVGIMATELLTPDNQYITIPNTLVWGSPIINLSRMETRRVNVDVGISYNGSIEKAVSTAMAVMKKHKLVLKDPEPAVVVTELADSSVNLQLRAWAKTGDFWTVKGDLTTGIFNAYNKEGVEIPYPQMDVHLDK